MISIESVKEHVDNANSGSIDLDDFAAHVLEQARRIQDKFSPFITIAERLELSGKGRLAGLPVVVKDNLCTFGMRTTAGSKILENYIPPFDATAVASANKEGAGVLGKTGMDEFGFGTFSTNCAFQIPKNPIDASRSCGGSSGGSACAVAAADFPVVSIAESTGGSITCPAAFTGTVGLTPTYGLVSRWGLIDYANSLDKIGPITKTVYDAALVLSVIAGADSKDSTSLDIEKKDYTKAVGNDCKGMRIGIPKEYFSDAVDKGIKDKVFEAVNKMENEGITCEETSLPSTAIAIPTYYVISMSEASTNLAKFGGLRYGLQPELEGSVQEYFTKTRTMGFGEEAKRRIILGTFMRMSGYRNKYYIKAMKVRKIIIDEFKHAFEKYDALIAPSMPILPPKFSEIEKLEPAQIYGVDVLTVAPNLAGVPTISVPFGSVSGLPVGVQLIADHLQEQKLIALGSLLEAIR
ncbi:MAG: Asp-tRNA(Asn)/Glu-tRNA(Gln) amidotransferase subunit GatA [Candidatus Micrarchaeaceae archaeon]